MVMQAQRGVEEPGSGPYKPYPDKPSSEWISAGSVLACILFHLCHLTPFCLTALGFD
jgi:hypothetical protein